jgi:acetyl-CoA acetyltransferase
MSGVFIVAAKRTPIGTFGGRLKGISATELCVHVRLIVDEDIPIILYLAPTTNE